MNNEYLRKRRLRFLPLLFMPAMLLGLSAVVMLLWNAILPNLLHVSTINYWQAAGLLLLCRILSGGFRGAPGGWRQPRGGPYGRMREKWNGMSGEERENFRSEWQKRCRPGEKGGGNV